MSWVLRGASSVLPKKRSGCAAFQSLMTLLEHPYVMPCVAAAYVTQLNHLLDLMLTRRSFDPEKDAAAIVRPAIRQVIAAKSRRAFQCFPRCSVLLNKNSMMPALRRAPSRT